MRKSIFLAIAFSSLLASTAFADPSAMERDKAQIESDKHVLAIDRDKLQDASKQLQHDRMKMMDDEHRLQIDKQNSNGGKQHFWNKKAQPQQEQKPDGQHAASDSAHPQQSNQPQAPVTSPPQPAAPGGQ